MDEAKVASDSNYVRKKKLKMNIHTKSKKKVKFRKTDFKYTTKAFITGYSQLHDDDDGRSNESIYYTNTHTSSFFFSSFTNHCPFLHACFSILLFCTVWKYGHIKEKFLALGRLLFYCFSKAFSLKNNYALAPTMEKTNWATSYFFIIVFYFLFPFQ